MLPLLLQLNLAKLHKMIRLSGDLKTRVRSSARILFVSVRLSIPDRPDSWLLYPDSLD